MIEGARGVPFESRGVGFYFALLLAFAFTLVFGSGSAIVCYVGVGVGLWNNPRVLALSLALKVGIVGLRRVLVGLGGKWLPMLGRHCDDGT